MLLECPNCGAVFGMEEIDWQECHCCGWPHNDEDEDEDYYNDDDEDCIDWDDGNY